MTTHQFLQVLLYISYGFASVIGFIMWANLSPKFWRSFPVYLLAIFLLEMVGVYFAKTNQGNINRVLTNYIIIPFEYLFIYFIFYSVFNTRQKKVVLFFSFLFLSAFIIEFILLLDVKWIYRSLTSICGSLTVLILCVIYFLDLLNSEKVIDYQKDPFFWVCLGLLTFYVGTFPLFATANYLYKVNLQLTYILSYAMFFFNYFMYLMFAKAFLCFKKVPRY